MPHPLKLENYRIMIDSGAHTLYVQEFAGKRGNRGKVSSWGRANAKYEFAESEKFKKYLEAYIEFVHENKEFYDFHVTLDLIGEPKKSWDVTKYMESCGLNPMPVFHVGEDFKWLRKMMDEYDYIGIGGLGQDVSKEMWIPFGNECFKTICDDRGRPRVKTHGFAMATPDLMVRYPWHTADASTWTYMARCGTVLIPRPVWKGTKVAHYDYTITPYALPVTEGRLYASRHHEFHPPTIKRFFRQYFEQNGYSYEKAKESYHARDVLNLRWFLNMQRQLQVLYGERFDYAEGGTVLLAGTPSGASTNLNRFINLLHDMKEPSTCWLGSFYYAKHNENLLSVKKAQNKGKDLHKLQLKKRKVVKEKPATKTKKVEKPRAQIQSKRPPVRFQAKLTFNLDYVVSAQHYAGLSKAQMVEKELEDLKQNFLHQIESKKPEILLEIANGEKNRIAENAESSRAILDGARLHPDADSLSPQRRNGDSVQRLPGDKAEVRHRIELRHTRKDDDKDVGNDGNGGGGDQTAESKSKIYVREIEGKPSSSRRRIRLRDASGAEFNGLQHDSDPS